MWVVLKLELKHHKTLVSVVITRRNPSCFLSASSRLPSLAYLLYLPTCVHCPEVDTTIRGWLNKRFGGEGLRRMLRVSMPPPKMIYHLLGEYHVPGGCHAAVSAILPACMVVTMVECRAEKAWEWLVWRCVSAWMV
jgi:hypothetical protein